MTAKPVHSQCLRVNARRSTPSAAGMGMRNATSGGASRGRQSDARCSLAARWADNGRHDQYSPHTSNVCQHQDASMRPLLCSQNAILCSIADAIR